MLQVKLWVVVVVVPAVVSVVSVVGLAGFGRVADRCSVRGVGAAWLAAFLAAVAPNWADSKWSQCSPQALVKIGAISDLLAFGICYGTRRHDERPG